ncbi:cytochrome P450 [Mycena rosella]|uniref:Cytochrome P450 n=1 Tax=Mycena rosella TaxID=1033263 RepID=A0AAD7GVG0_MYCRO|nr:cytochrome P450 [Mycena rosella]
MSSQPPIFSAFPSAPSIIMRELESFALLSVLCCAIAYFWSGSFKSSLPLPPGPKASWSGRVDLPRIRPWLTYAEWKDVYGDLIYIRVFGNPILVLNSAAVAADLLEKRGGNYSSRPKRVMVVDLIGWDWLVSAFQYGSWWRRHRIMFTRHLPQNESSSIRHPLQIQETHVLLRSLLHSPLEFRYHIRKLAAGIILKMTYGLRVGTGDEYTVLADRAIASLAQAGIFGTYLVDYMPFLKHAPAWFPFKRKALEWRKLTRAMLNSPFACVKDELAKGVASKCMVSEELERSEGADPTGESVIKNVAATMFTAGADTVVSALSTFFLVMAIYPDVQKQAQKEMDQIIGHGQRLPLLTDRSQLPFIDYICYELLRWNPVTPLGIAHYVQEEDEYNGFRIPAGTTVLPNVWAILHDPDMYPAPLTFNPQRFAPENRENGLNQIPDPAFGFGRRACPGKFLAFDTMWIVVASMLTVYSISKEIDETGAVKEPIVEFTPHLLSHPMPFACTIVPRSAAARQLIVQTELDN